MPIDLSPPCPLRSTRAAGAGHTRRRHRHASLYPRLFLLLVVLLELFNYPGTAGWDAEWIARRPCRRRQATPREGIDVRRPAVQSRRPAAPVLRCWSNGRFKGRRRRHGHEHGDHGDGLLGQRLLRALRLHQAALRASPPVQGGRRPRRCRRRLRRQRGARHPRPGAVRGDDLPHRQARRRRRRRWPANAAGAGGVAVHGVSGGVRGQGRGARAPRLRPRLPRGLHRRLAEAAPHLPRLPRLPARQERHPRRAARLQPPRRRRRSEGLRGRRPAGRPRVLLVRPRRVTAGSRTPAPDGRHGCRWPAGDHLRRARLVGRPEPCCCCWRWW